MQKRFLIALFISIYFISCDNNNDVSKPKCYYKLEQLINIDTPEINITYPNDTIIEVQDKVKDSSSFGLYTFDKEKNLRFYGFFIDQANYKYSEEYDSSGNLIKTEGSPLVEYRLWKQNKDTIVFTISLFALNKKFEEIEIVSNRKDTIRPKYLFKSNIYSNVKCFSFKLPILNNKDSLTLYARGIIINTCTLKKENFSDTALIDKKLVL